MSDIIRQVDEDLRREKISDLVRKYGVYLISLVIIIVITVVGYQLTSSINKTKNENLVENYIKANNEENFNQQLLLFEEIIGTNNEYLSSLADFKKLNLLMENDNIEEGMQTLNKISKNMEYDKIVRNLASYFLFMYKIDEYSEDEFELYINDLDQNTNFVFLFRELYGIKKLLNGKNEDSKRIFQELVTLPDTPNGIKIRASKFIEIIN